MSEMEGMDVPSAVAYGATKTAMQRFYAWIKENTREPLLTDLFYDYLNRFLIDERQRFRTQSLESKAKKEGE